MVIKRFKKKNTSKNIREITENEYLRRLEQSITGKSGEILYLKPQTDKQNNQDEEKVDIWGKLEPKIPQIKEPPRIPIELALGDDNNLLSPVEKVEKPKSISIEEIVDEPKIPVPEERITPPPQPFKESIPQLVKETIPQPVKETIPQPVKETTPPPESKTEPETPPILVKGLYDSGTIIGLEDGSICIYKGPIPGKEYHLIYHLRPDGSISPEGICLYAYRSNPLGHINENLCEEMLRSMRWERDRIVEHLSSQEKMRLIPLLSPKHIKKEVTEPSRKRESLERGRRLRIGFGDRLWDAVYWGSDELGQIVAHNTNKTWTLMHLNLGRFGDSLEYGELLSTDELKEINDSLSEALSIGD